MSTSLATPVLAQAVPAQVTQLDWMLGTLGFSSLLVFVSALLIFGGACYLIATRRRPSVLAAYLVLLPLPVLISLCGVLKGNISSLMVIAASPDLTLTTADIAGGLADSLFGLFVALLISAPTYFVLAYGLLAGTLRPPTDSAAPAAIPSDRRAPLLNPAGPLPAVS